MRWPEWMFTPTLLALLAGGCAAVSPASQTAARSARPAVPLALIGEDARVTLDFNSHPPVTTPHDLGDAELCYLMLGDAVLVCTREGSYLLFGPEDGVVLINDNPFARLRPDAHDSAAGEMMQMYDTLFMIAGSVDRLPDGLADYLNDPGPHRRQAMAAAKQLLDHDGGNLAGAARGGTFAVSLQLTESGHDKLQDALDSDDNPLGIYQVRWPGHRPKRIHPR